MNLPEVTPPTQRRLSFKEKLKWTGLILVLFFILGMIPLFGLDPGFVNQFEYLQIILASKFGSIISLGIGPIVTASIVLQLLDIMIPIRVSAIMILTQDSMGIIIMVITIG